MMMSLAQSACKTTASYLAEYLRRTAPYDSFEKYESESAFALRNSLLLVYVNVEIFSWGYG